jgi:hypothetical protein
MCGTARVFPAGSSDHGVTGSAGGHVLLKCTSEVTGKWQWLRHWEETWQRGLAKHLLKSVLGLVGFNRKGLKEMRGWPHLCLSALKFASLPRWAVRVILHCVMQSHSAMKMDASWASI